MSANEKAFMELNDNVVIYRVFNFNSETNIGEIERITADDLKNHYCFDPVTFKVTRK
jgi:hypothetical protein